jgi:O-antigen ligase
MSPGHLIYLIFLIELFLSGFWYTSSLITQAFLFVTLAVGCRAVLLRRTVIAYSSFGLMLIYLAWLVIVALSSEVSRISTMTLATLANLPVIYLVASNTPTFSEIWKYLRAVFFLIGVGFAIWALWQVAFFIGAGEAVGPLSDRNLFAALINALWFPSAFLFLKSRVDRYLWKPILLGIGLFIMNTALFSTVSRGGIGAWILLLPILLWAGYQNIHCRRLVVFIPLIAILAYFCSTQILQENFIDRTFAVAQDDSTHARLLLWQSSIDMAIAHPIVGTGWGTFYSYYPTYRSPLEYSSAGIFAHNDYLQMAAEGGFVAAFLLMGLLLAVLFQLKRSLRCAADLAGLESIALLLGTLALFIHAGVNFIFYVAFMNILAGLYLARAAQLADKSCVIEVSWLGRISLPVIRTISGVFAILITLYLAPGLAAQLINSKANIKISNIESPDLTAYQIAKLITTIEPEERVAQEIVLRTSELALADSNFVSRVGDDFLSELLSDTLARFDNVRAQTANDPDIGVRQARVLIAHQSILDANITNADKAYAKAHQVLRTNLKVDPYHTDSIILRSRLYALQGRYGEALDTLKQSEHLVFGRTNQNLIALEILRQLALPEIFPELNDIEMQLQQAKSSPEARMQSVFSDRFNDNIQSRLDGIAAQISKVK